VNNEPRGIFDYREPDVAYKQALAAAFDQGTLNFSFFNVRTAKPEDQLRPVGDITFTDHRVVIEVKTKADLVGSMLSGRLQWQIWYMWLLLKAGAVKGFAILIRGISDPLDRFIVKNWLTARRMLFKHAIRYEYSVLFAEDGEDVVEIAKSYMREYFEPKEPEMPYPYFPKEILDQPPVVTQIAATVHNFAVIRSTELAADKSPAEFWTDCLADKEDFIEMYREKYGIKDTLLGEVWDTANKRQTVPAIEPSVFIMKDPKELIR
jgi:hypothetical protein